MSTLQAAPNTESTNAVSRYSLTAIICQKHETRGRIPRPIGVRKSLLTRFALHFLPLVYRNPRRIEVWQVQGSTIDVFFYGLFMDESLLASKGVRPKRSEPGHVEGYRLHIGERATLLPANDDRCYGVLMEITADEAAILYSDASVCDYVAEPVVVHLRGDKQVDAVCFNLPASKLTGASLRYAADLLALATRLGMPECYLARIRSAAEPP